MTRGKFIALSMLTGLGSTLSLPATSTTAPSNLMKWLSSHSAASSVSNEFITASARIPNHRLLESLQSLSQLCDHQLSANGNLFQGSCQGMAFELTLTE